MSPRDPKRKRDYHIPNLARGQSSQLDEGQGSEAKTVYTTERPDGLLIAHDSRPVGFGPAVEAWDLELGSEG